MTLTDVLERNRAFIQGRAARPLPPPESVPLVVITCYDPRLDAFLRPALGLDDGRAFLIRSAGAVVAPSGDPLRSIALATYLFAAEELLVVGHTSCRMAAFETSGFIDAFRARGVARGAFGDSDLRQWAGAIHDPVAGVRASVAALREAPCLPKDLRVSGVVLDDRTGGLTVVVRPDEAVGGGARHTAPPSDNGREENQPAEPSGMPEPGGPAALPRAQVKDAGHRSPAEGAGAADRLLAAASRLAETVAAQAVWRYELDRLRTELRMQGNPLVRVRLIDAFVRKAAADSREVAAALDGLKREATAAGRRLDETAFLELVRRAFMGEPS